MTLRQAVSDVVGDLKAYNLDDKYSYRFLASKLRGNIENFLKQDAVDRSIFKINELWKPLKNIDLKDSYNDTNNIYFDSKTTIKKSIHKIPDVYTCKYGNLIKITNVNNSIEYQPTKPFQYKDIKNREFSDPNVRYYWIEDGYLYIPDSEVEEVRAYGLFKDSQEADVFNGVVDCCFKPLDSILLVPDYIITIAKKQVYVDLIAGKNIIEDSNPDQNTNNK